MLKYINYKVLPVKAFNLAVTELEGLPTFNYFTYHQRATNDLF